MFKAASARNVLPRAARCFLLVTALAAAETPLSAMTPARTPEGIQKKAVVIKHDAKLFSASKGDAGKESRFMQIYFLLEGTVGGRSPVTLAPNRTEPDGWLAAGSFVEWNTLQMINFEAQGGRELARIFEKSACSERYGRTGEAGGCPELGSEPQRAGKVRDNYNLLIPVFESDQDNYRGGFVRVTAEEGPVVKPSVAPPSKEAVKRKLGYDLILVVDSTASMEQWFRPTTEVLREFLSNVRQEIGTEESQVPFHAGLLLYRDRKKVQDCDIGYLNQWEVDLTDGVDRVIQALTSATQASCSSDDVPEAVFDALSRAVQDPKWNDGSFHVVLLVGDAPPHPASDLERNPLKLSTPDITKLAEERNIRFLTFKIGPDGAEEFRDLALAVKDKVLGRFATIEPNIADFKQQLSAAIRKEWALLTKANVLIESGQIVNATPGSPAQPRAGSSKLDIDKYDLPIILANLPPGSTGSGAPEFVEGWVPKLIKKKLTMGEYIFLEKTQARTLTNVLDSVSAQADAGEREGGDSFLASLRTSLATMLKVQPEDVFRSGESLDSMMNKANILPFRTTVLSFTAEEVNTWKPADFQRLNKILGEKALALREFLQKPGNIHLFGGVEHLYIPRVLFP